MVWTIKVSGTFTYDGNTATCTVANAYTTVYSDDWKLTKTATKSGNKAIANAVAKKYSLLGSLLKTVNKSVTLTCDPNGNLS